MKILLSGGGTLGSVTPLLAIKEIISEKYPEASFVWVGTKEGPEKEVVNKNNVPFIVLKSGKYRRYFSLKNYIDFLKIIYGFFQSFSILIKEKPDLCISAGGFVSVPLHYAAWFCGIPTWVHQLDVQVGLANRLMAPLAKVITNTLENTTKIFKKRKSIWLGNPIRSDIFFGKTEKAVEIFNLKTDKPIVFATGGGTGSLRVNQLVVEALQYLDNCCQIIHLTGRERPQELCEKAAQFYPDYRYYQFFNEEIKHAYAAADLIISRGGFGTISEIAALNKPAILIPKPGQQEENVKFLADAGAVVLVDEDVSDGIKLAEIIKKLLKNKTERAVMADKMHEMMPVAGKENIITILDGVLEKNSKLD